MKKQLIFGIIVLSLVSLVVLETTNIGYSNNSERTCDNPGVYVIYQTGCPHCADALPRLKELESERNANFTYWDLAKEEDRSKFLETGFEIKGVPTVVVNCTKYPGEKSKARYEDLIFGNG